MPIFLLIALIAAAVVLVNLYQRNQKQKINEIVRAGYDMRVKQVPVSGFSDDVQYDFYIDYQWLGIDAAYEHLQKSKH